MESRNPLKRPFPDREFGRSVVYGMARIGLFVAAALYFLRPLGVQGGMSFVMAMGYGLVTFVVATAYVFMTTEVLGIKKSGDKWTLGWWIVDCAVLLFVLSLANFIFYNATVGWTAFSPIVFIYIAVPTVIVGLFPITFSGMAVQLRAERENQQTAGYLQNASLRRGENLGETPAVRLGEVEVLEINPKQLLYCEAQLNYVRCVYTGEEGKPEEKLLRTTLATVEAQLADTHVMRCHRSFLVQPERVLGFNGNAQGLKLKFRNWPEAVPVSRKYVGVFRNEVLG